MRRGHFILPILAMAFLAAAAPAAEPRLTIIGTRLTRGDAVECPKLRGDDGKVHSVHYLPPSVAIGARVSVTGYVAKLVRCRGPVLHVEDLRLFDER